MILKGWLELNVELVVFCYVVQGYCIGICFELIIGRVIVCNELGLLLI